MGAPGGGSRRSNSSSPTPAIHWVETHFVPRAWERSQGVKIQQPHTCKAVCGGLLQSKGMGAIGEGFRGRSPATPHLRSVLEELVYGVSVMGSGFRVSATRDDGMSSAQGPGVFRAEGGMSVPEKFLVVHQAQGGKLHDAPSGGVLPQATAWHPSCSAPQVAGSLGRALQLQAVSLP